MKLIATEIRNKTSSQHILVSCNTLVTVKDNNGIYLCAHQLQQLILFNILKKRQKIKTGSNYKNNMGSDNLQSSKRFAWSTTAKGAYYMISQLSQEENRSQMNWEKENFEHVSKHLINYLHKSEGVRGKPREWLFSYTMKYPNCPCCLFTLQKHFRRKIREANIGGLGSNSLLFIMSHS